MGRLGLVRMGWLVEGMFVVRTNHVWCAELAECMSICGSHTNWPAATEPYVGSGTIM